MDRQKIVSIMQEWIGGTTGSPIHHEIIDTYNTLNPLPRGHKLTESDPWCAATVTAAFIKAGYTKILPGECSCGKMIDQLKILSEWCESDSYVPNVGDLIFFAWNDPSPKSDNTEGHDHVGMVEFCAEGFIHTIEGNYSNMVKRRTLKVDGANIRGFGVMRYDDGAELWYKAQKGDTLSKVCQKFGVNKADVVALNPKTIKAPLYWLYNGKEYRLK